MNQFLAFYFIFVHFGELLQPSFGVHKKDMNYDSYDTNNGDTGGGDRYNVDQSSSNEEFDSLDVVPVANWPKDKIDFGQVSSVSLDTQGNVYVFHRDKRSWGQNSFRPDNTFAEVYLGPITNPTVAVIHPKSGTQLYAWGQNMFYMPHGITVDYEDNVWITDVALHQVFKFPPLLKSDSSNTKSLLELGTRFIPGNSKFQFCKPSAVAVLPSGEFFVSDGYCNTRVIKFSADGSWMTEWGRSTLTHGVLPPPPYNFFIPHDLTLVDDRGLVCVSDRENGRVQCFHVSNGSYVFEINSPHEIGSRLFSASYTSLAGGLFFIVNGPVSFDREDVHGSIVSTNFDHPKLLKTFQPSGLPFRNPHDVIVSPNGTEMYVAELDPHRVCKFEIMYKGQKGQKFLMTQHQTQEDNRSSGTMLMAIFITAVVLCFGAVLLAAALIYSKARTRGCTGHCKNPKWLIGRSTVEGFKIGNFLGQQHQGFVKLNNYEESDEDDANVNPTFA